MAALDENKLGALSADLKVGRFTDDILAPDIWARAAYFCEYCDDDLLVDFQTYGAAQGDHILPKSKYPRLENKLNNYASACGTCNRLKRNWDPAGADIAAFAALDDLTNEQRRKLIDRCKAYLNPLGQQKEAELKRVIEILKRHSLR